MNQRDQKIHNLFDILELIRTRSGVSQAEIASLLSLQPSTVSNLMRELRTAGMVRTAAKGASGSAGGKKADLLSIDPDYGCFAGFYLRSDEFGFRVLDFGERVLLEEGIGTTPANSAGAGEVISQAIEQHGKRFGNLRGAGIAVSSVVTEEGDVVPSSHFEQGIPHVVSTVQERFPGISVVAENDANALAFYVLAKGRKQRRNILHLLVRERPFTVGGGLVLDGELYRGRRGGAGEIPDEMLESGDPVGSITRLIVLLGQVLDLDAVSISTDAGSDIDRRLRRRLESSAIPVDFIGDNMQAVNGVALLALQAHIDSMLPLATRKQRRR